MIPKLIPAALSVSSTVIAKPLRTTTALAFAREFNLNNSICLTFDDGPDPIYTPEILSILADFDVKATFFVLGEAAEKWPNLLEQMIESGHSIGNHTYSHCHPWAITSEKAEYEVDQASAIIKVITGNAPRWFRPPFGRVRRSMLKQAEKHQMTTVLWSHSIIDWGPLGTEAGIAKRLENIKPSDIVLMHDGMREHNRPDLLLKCLPHFLKSLSETKLTAYPLDGVF